MQNSAWVALLRLMPPALHDKLTFVTRIGQEITVQNLLRIEDDFVVIRGRMAATMDAGRVFVIPYAEIHYVGFQQAMKEAEVVAIFGGQNTVTSSAEEQAPAAAEPVPEPEATAPVEPAPLPEPTPPPSSSVEIETKPKHAKGILLERVRARLAASGQARAAGPS